jgi:hypothetical protein
MGTSGLRDWTAGNDYDRRGCGRSLKELREGRLKERRRGCVIGTNDLY